MNTTEKIYTQHTDHTEWISKLKFYTDEISILKNRLAEIAKKNSHKDVLAQVEHFQNQFIVQKNNIDEISHAIKMDEARIQKEIDINPTASDHRKTEGHSKEKESVEDFEKNFTALRAAFKKFALKRL